MGTVWVTPVHSIPQRDAHLRPWQPVARHYCHRGWCFPWKVWLQKGKLNSNALCAPTSPFQDIICPKMQPFWPRPSTSQCTRSWSTSTILNTRPAVPRRTLSAFASGWWARTIRSPLSLAQWAMIILAKSWRRRPRGTALPFATRPWTMPRLERVPCWSTTEANTDHCVHILVRTLAMLFNLLLILLTGASKKLDHHHLLSNGVFIEKAKIVYTSGHMLPGKW